MHCSCTLKGFFVKIFSFNIISSNSLLNIKWKVQHSGRVIPTAIFKSIYILDRKIERATLNNYKNVLKMKLEFGDEILVSLSNDVIPYIEENITKGIKQRCLK